MGTLYYAVNAAKTKAMALGKSPELVPDDVLGLAELPDEETLFDMINKLMSDYGYFDHGTKDEMALWCRHVTRELCVLGDIAEVISEHAYGSQYPGVSC